MSIICLAGRKGVGKDVFGNVLVKRYGFSRIALADPLRELCSSVFKMDYNLFLDNDKKDTDLGYKVIMDFRHIESIITYVEDKWNFFIDILARASLEDFFGKEFRTPREILTFVGTEIIRTYVRDDIWIVLAFEKISKLGGKVVVTDCRFENEREAFEKAGAVICLIKRDNDISKDTTKHISENNLGQEDDYDVVFTNDGTQGEFESTVSSWYGIRRNDLEFYTEFKHVTRKELDTKE